MKILLALLLSIPCLAQRAQLGLPTDNKATPLIAGLGLPAMCETTVTTATYTEYCAVPSSSGENTGRAWRHIQIYNPSTSKSVYVCLGGTSSCSTDMIKIRPGAAVTQDFALFGPSNEAPRIWLRLSASGSEVVDVNLW
jgi:tetrahydromethanopterin S-methyltransferase subunit H